MVFPFFYSFIPPAVNTKFQLDRLLLSCENNTLHVSNFWKDFSRPLNEEKISGKALNDGDDCSVDCNPVLKAHSVMASIFRPHDGHTRSQPDLILPKKGINSWCLQRRPPQQGEGTCTWRGSGVGSGSTCSACRQTVVSGNARRLGGYLSTTFTDPFCEPPARQTSLYLNRRPPPARKPSAATTTTTSATRLLRGRSRGVRQIAARGWPDRHALCSLS